MAESKPEETKKKSPIKLLLIILIVLLLVGGGGAGYYFFMYHPAESGEHAKGADAKAGHKEKEKEEEEEHEGSAEAEQEVYQSLNMPLMVPYPPGSSAKVIKISLTVLLKNQAGADVLKKHDPMIRNNLLMVISSVGADKAKTVEGKKELRALMLSEIGKVMEKMAGKNSAKEVFFTDFVMQ